MQLNPIFYLKPAQLNVNVEVTVVGKNVILSCEWLHEVWENVCVLDNKPRCNLKTFTVVTLCHRLIFPLLVIKTISWYNKGISRVMWEKNGEYQWTQKNCFNTSCVYHKAHMRFSSEPSCFYAVLSGYKTVSTYSFHLVS